MSDNDLSVIVPVLTVRLSEAELMQLWRKAGLPEYFLGNGGTNVRLCEFVRLVCCAIYERGMTHER